MDVQSASEAERFNRRIYVIAESDLNDARLVRVQELGGYGLDAPMERDFHLSFGAGVAQSRLLLYFILAPLPCPSPSRCLPVAE